MMAPASDSRELAARLFEDYGPAVRGYLRRATGRADVADDLLQEAYLRVVRGTERYQPRERERAWVFRIARNVFLDFRRQETRETRWADTNSDAVAQTAPAQEIRIHIDEALRLLDAVDRDAFLLCELGGLSYDEIAKLLGITAAGVRSRIYRTRLSLRTKLKPLARGPAVVPPRSVTDDH